MIGDLYARKSTKDDGRSAARQERDWRADCADEGIQPGRVFVDPDLSASRYARKERPGYGELLAHLRSGEADMVCLWEASRGSRKPSEWLSFLDLCRDLGILIRIFSDGGQTFDVRRHRDYRALADEGLNAYGESERLAERIRAGNRDAASLGRPPGPLLFGYARIYDAPSEGAGRSASGGRRLTVEQVVNTEEAAIIRQMVADTLAGIPLNTQARRLIERGTPVPSGQGRWTGSHINRMLRHPGYVGHRVYKGEVVKENAWPAIISEDEHRMLCNLLEAPGRRNHADSSLSYQLSGAALCGACERVLRAGAGKVGRGRYECRWTDCNRVAGPMAKMDAFVDLMVTTRLQEPDGMKVFAPPADDAALAAAKREKRELQDHLDGFYEMAGKKRLSGAGLAKVEAEILPQIEAVERKIRKLSTPPVLHRLAGMDVVGGWPRLPVGTRREIILALAEVRLSPVGKGGRWSPWRLGESRWLGDQQTWGEKWRAAGAVPG